jgi:hypothetical protein
MFTLFPSAENKKLEKLNLSWNNIRGKGAVSIFKGIKGIGRFFPYWASCTICMTKEVFILFM